MCTAIAWMKGEGYFGRTLDLEHSYGEGVVITPRQYPFVFRHVPAMNTHYALIGMAITAGEYPLYFDAVNEKGLGMAGLNFPGNAHFFEPADGVDNIAPFEFIPWVLGQCGSVAEAQALLARIRLVNTSFSEQMPVAPLHWIIADKNAAITVECMADGLHIYDNPVGVLTNNPPFPHQMDRLRDYQHLSPDQPANTMAPAVVLGHHSKGMGAIGLPGDLSSPSRFARATFFSQHARAYDTEEEQVSQYFHIIGSVNQVAGVNRTHEGDEITVYTSCCNLTTGVYYTTTYHNRQIAAVALQKENLEGTSLVSYPLCTIPQIQYRN